MSTAPWWLNWLSGLVSLGLAVNFFAVAYGLRVGERPLRVSDFPKYEPRPQDQMWPPFPLGGKQ